MEKAIIGLAGLFFIGHVLQWVFVKTKIPDLLILIIAGFFYRAFHVKYYLSPTFGAGGNRSCRHSHTDHYFV